MTARRTRGAVPDNPVPDLPALILALAAELEIKNPQPWGDGVAETLRRIYPRLRARQNLRCCIAGSDAVAGTEYRTAALPCRLRLPPWILRDPTPPWFAHAGQIAEQPLLRVARAAPGFIVQFGHAPIVLAADGLTVLRDLSSRYAPLIHFAAVDLAAIVANARHVPGAVFLLSDDIFPPNYSHWLLDALPRLEALHAVGWRDGVTLVTHDRLRPYQRETLERCGWGADQVIELAPMRALRADAVIATSDQPQPPHPMFKGAARAARFLRHHLGPPAPLGTRADSGTGRRLYMSRDDAEGRRVVNEDEVMHALAARGFERVSMRGKTVTDQARLFAGAAWIVAPHGAALANLVFAPPGATVLELFPATYGTPAYYVLAAAMQLRYACHVAPEAAVSRRENPQLDDFSVDPAAVVERYGDFLPNA